MRSSNLGIGDIRRRRGNRSRGVPSSHLICRKSALLSGMGAGALAFLRAMGTGISSNRADRIILERYPEFRNRSAALDMCKRPAIGLPFPSEIPHNFTFSPPAFSRREQFAKPFISLRPPEQRTAALRTQFPPDSHLARAQRQRSRPEAEKSRHRYE